MDDYVFEDGEVVEECPRCMGAGVLDNEDGYMVICDKCDARGYIPHLCIDELGEV